MFLIDGGWPIHPIARVAFLYRSMAEDARPPRSRKALLAGAMFVAMLVLSGALLVRSGLAELHDANVRLTGIAPAGEVLKLIRVTQLHRGLSSMVLGGSASADVARRDRKQELDRAITDSLTGLRTLRAPAIFARLERIATDWERLSSEVAAGTVNWDESFDRHTTLVIEEIGLLTDIAKATGIAGRTGTTGDRALRALLRPLPQLTEVLGQLRARGGTLLVRTEAEAQDRLRIDALAVAAREYLYAARRSLSLVDGDVSPRGRLAPPASNPFATASAGFALVDDTLLQSERLELPADWFVMTSRTIDAQFGMIDSALALLRDEVEAQIASARTRLLLVVEAIVVLASVSIAVALSAARSYKRVAGMTASRSNRSSEK